jgi:maltose alpha-D-glucosyltransferase/alpha-amylase
VEFAGADPEWYAAPLTFVVGDEAERLRRDEPQRVMAELTITGSGQAGVLYDPLGLREFDVALLEVIAQRRRLKGTGGNVVGWRGPLLRALPGMETAGLESAPLKTRQRHSSVRFGEWLVMKLFRRLHWGVHPELELGRFLTEGSFAHAPPLAGALEYHRADGERLALAAVHGWVAKAESGWEYTLQALDRYYERVLSLPAEGRKFPPVDARLIPLVRQEFPAEVPELVGTYLESARLLGLRTAELHQALAADGRTAEFAPEPFTTYYQRSLYQTMRNTARHSLQKLRDELPHLPEDARPVAQRVLDLEAQLLKRFYALLAVRVSAARIRCHGDYGLGQVLHTGKDFVIVDYEGHPKQVMSERRIKRLVLRDVTGMLCSFRYATDMALTRQVALNRLTEEERHTLAPSADGWRLWVSVAFLKGYFDTLGRSPLLPATDAELQALLEIYLLHRSVDELGDHLASQTALVRPACEGILEQLQPQQTR